MSKKSSSLRVIGKRDRLITTWEEWERPVARRQWKEGRNAMEIAKAFFRQGAPELPALLAQLLSSHRAFRGFVGDEVRPEYLTRLPPSGSSGPRNHDVWIRGALGRGCGVVGIEAKADESFGDRLATQFKKQSASRAKRSKVEERLEILGGMLFGRSFDLRDPRFGAIGYQLLSGMAGTAIQAAHDGADAAVFVVYEFATSQTTARKRARNAADLDAFVALLPGQLPALRAGTLTGPLRLSAGKHLDRAMELYIGKVVDPVSAAIGAS